MLPRTRKLLALLVRPGIDQVILLLARGPTDETSVKDHLGVSQSTANRALRDLEDWGIAAAEVLKTGRSRGRKKRIWRLTDRDVIALLDSADVLTAELLEQQVAEVKIAQDEKRRSRIANSDAGGMSAA